MFSDDGDMAVENVEEAKKDVAQAKVEEQKFEQKEEMEEAKEKEEEKAEDKDFTSMQKELKKDMAQAKANPGQGTGASRVFVDTEILAVNRRVHTLSQRIEDVSERIHNLAQLVEHLPTKVAELELAVAGSREGMDRSAVVAKPKPLKTAGTQPAAAGDSSKSFWGVQVGAYKTKVGAENAWGEILTNQTAVELNDAEVRYVPSKPLKSGKQLTLIILNQYPSFKAADSACKGLKDKGVDCVAVRANP